jgi:hypothetical protein
MSLSLSQMIDQQLGVAAEPVAPRGRTITPVREDPASGASLADEAEKVASVLDYLAGGGLEKIAGRADTDEARKIPGRGTGINTLHTQRGTSHPALENARAAAAAGKGDVARANTPALRLALTNEPYADPATGSILSAATNHRDVNARRRAAAQVELARRKGA